MISPSRNVPDSSAKTPTPVARASGVPVPVSRIAGPGGGGGPQVGVRPRAAVPVSQVASGTDSPQKKKRWFMLLGGNSLLISVLLHLFVGVGATFFIVETFQKKRVDFHAEPPPSPHNEVEHKIEMAKKNNVESAPPDLKRITTTDLTAITLPDVPNVPAPATPSPEAMGAGDGQMGSGIGSGNGTGGNGGGLALPTFGAPNGNGLEGNFFDFTQDQGGNRIATTGPLADIVTDFVKAWKPSKAHDYYKSPHRIKSPRLFVPVIPDEQAGEAFQSPESSHAYWLVHYHMSFSSGRTGKYRFLGWGDNVLIVAIDGKVVLDASDHQYLKLSFNTHVGNMTLPNKSGPTPIFLGDSFTIAANDKHDIDVIIGDEGGVTTSALFIQRDGDPLTFAEDGAPKVPLFVVGTLSDADKSSLSTYLPPECFTSEPLFMDATPPDDGN